MLTTYYVLNWKSVVTEVGGGWDSFAHESGGEEAVGERVVGRVLWDFVYGFPTKTYLSDVFYWCRRTGLPFETAYRCDTPTLRRNCVMHVVPGSEGSLKVISKPILTSTDAGNVARLSQYGADKRCGTCGDILLGDTWYPVTSPPSAHDFPPSLRSCAVCSSRALRSASAGSVVRFPDPTS